MKTWNTPEVKELNITETAGGILPADFETVIFFHDTKGSSTPDSDDKEEKDPVNMQS